jgi:hypothetical protein
MMFQRKNPLLEPCPKSSIQFLGKMVGPHLLRLLYSKGWVTLFGVAAAA